MRRRRVSAVPAGALVCPPRASVLSREAVPGGGGTRPRLLGLPHLESGSAVSLAEVVSGPAAGGEKRKEALVHDGGGGLRAAEAVSPVGCGR